MYRTIDIFSDRKDNKKAQFVTRLCQLAISCDQTRLEVKGIMKSAADTGNHATDRRISVGDDVFTKQRKNNKLTPVFNSSTLTVTKRNGSIITERS